MASFFFDLDGTIFEWGTNTPLPGIVDRIKVIKAAGHQLYITTKRGRTDKPESHVFSKPNTLKALADSGIEIDGIIFASSSPRIVVNDRGCAAIKHEQNSPWTIDLMSCLEGLDEGG